MSILTYYFCRAILEVQYLNGPKQTSACTVLYPGEIVPVHWDIQLYSLNCIILKNSFKTKPALIIGCLKYMFVLSKNSPTKNIIWIMSRHLLTLNQRKYLKTIYEDTGVFGNNYKIINLNLFSELKIKLK